MQKYRVLEFIGEYNPSDTKEIYQAIEKHRKGLPLAWITALIWGESCFDPETITGLGKGLGQLEPFFYISDTV